MSVAQLSVQESTADTDPGPAGQAAAECFRTPASRSHLAVSRRPPLVCYNITNPDKARNHFISAPVEAPVSTKYKRKKNTYVDLLLRAGSWKSSQSTQTHSLNVSPCNCPATFSSFHLSSSSALGERGRREGVTEGWRVRRQQQMLGGCVNVNVLT